MKIAKLENYAVINLGVIENAITRTERNGDVSDSGWEFSNEELSKFMSWSTKHDVKVERDTPESDRAYLSYDGVKIPLYFNVGYLDVEDPEHFIFPEGNEAMPLREYMFLFKLLGDLVKHKKEQPPYMDNSEIKYRLKYEFKRLMSRYELCKLGKAELSYEWGENPQEVFILGDGKPFIMVNLEDFAKGYALRDILRMRHVLKNICFLYPKTTD